MSKSLPWPDEYRGLFLDSGDHHEYAHFGWGDLDIQFAGYLMGYKRSADLLIESAISSGDISQLDTVVFPALFLYRQYIELSLKQSILVFTDGNHSDKVALLKRTSHDLDHLWQEVLRALPDPRPDDDAHLLAVVGQYIHEFSRMDRTSASFRYPITKDLALTFSEQLRVNLRHVKTVLAELESFFDGYFGYLSTLQDPWA